MATPENTTPLGEFEETLLRDPKTIKRDRAKTIIDSARLVYKRKVEDLALELTNLRRQQSSALDLSPDNTFQILNPNKFDAKVFSDADSELALNIARKELALTAIKKRYEQLFGIFKES